MGHGDLRLADDAHVRARRCARPPPRRGTSCCSSPRRRSACPRTQLVVENGVVSVKGEPTRRSPTASSRRARRSRARVDEKAVLRAASRVHGDGPLAPPARRGRQGDRRRPATPADIRLPGLLLRADPAPARPRGDARARRHVRGREAGRRHGREPGRPRGRAPRRPRGGRGRARAPEARVERRRRPARTPTASSTSSSASAPAPEVQGAKGDVEAAQAAARAAYRGDVPQGLRRPRADGAARRRRPRSRTGSSPSGPRRRRPFPTRDRLAQALWRSTRRASASSRRTSAAASAARARGASPRRRRVSRRPRAGRCRWRARAPRSSSTTRSTRPRSSRSRSAMDAAGKITLWDYDVYFAGDRGGGALLRRAQRPHARLRRAGGAAAPTPTASASARGARRART